MKPQLQLNETEKLPVANTQNNSRCSVVCGGLVPASTFYLGRYERSRKTNCIHID